MTDIEKYNSQEPFPHIVIDNFLSHKWEDILYDVTGEWPLDSAPWNYGKKSSQQVNKRGIGDYKYFGQGTRQLMDYLTSAGFVKYIQRLTGIKEPLLADPNFTGGGLHETLNGGYLRVHADMNTHPLNGLDRRVNLILFCNGEWKEEWGGELQLYPKDMIAPNVCVFPSFNRAVIFNTTSDTYHGNPNPLTCPDNVSRRTLAIYYWSNGRPKEEKFQKHTTLFKPRNFKEKIEGWKEKAKLFIPPILIGNYTAKK